MLIYRIPQEGRKDKHIVWISVPAINQAGCSAGPLDLRREKVYSRFTGIPFYRISYRRNESWLDFSLYTEEGEQRVERDRVESGRDCTLCRSLLFG